MPTWFSDGRPVPGCFENVAVTRFVVRQRSGGTFLGSIKFIIVTYIDAVYYQRGLSTLAISFVLSLQFHLLVLQYRRQ